MESSEKVLGVKSGVKVTSKGRGESMENVPIQITCTYDADTKRMHRYIVDAGQPVSGTLYVPKGSKVPESVALKLRVKGADKT